MEEQNPDVAVVEPVLKAFCTFKAYQRDVHLHSCCPMGQLCCPRCARNVRFPGSPLPMKPARNAGPKRARNFRAKGSSPPMKRPLSDSELIQLVKGGQKPVGTIVVPNYDPALLQRLKKEGLFVAIADTDRWGMFRCVFTTQETGSRRFSQFVDLAVLKDRFGIVIEDKTILEHVTSRNFFHEMDSWTERGIVYGFPMWMCIDIELSALIELQ